MREPGGWDVAVEGFSVELFWTVMKVRVWMWDLGYKSVWFSQGTGGWTDYSLKQ